MNQPTSPDTSLSEFLRALFERSPSRGLIELRWPEGNWMGRSFHRLTDTAELSRQAAKLAVDRDVYFGVLARWRERGRRRDVVGSPRVVWVDCDNGNAVGALGEFAYAPSLVVRSGTAGHRHAYWLLSHAETIRPVERANRRLAVALGADAGVVTAAGAILRLPGTFNHKHDPSVAVELEVCEPGRRYPLAALVRGLPGDPAPPLRPTAGRARRRGDRLLEVAPELYVERLLGVRVGRSRKVRCPLHDDQRPSLHVYREPERGWFCFGCRRGGTVFDLAATLWDRPTRGAGFTALRADLERLLLS